MRSGSRWRDISKLIEAAVEEDRPGDWGGLWRRLRGDRGPIPRRAAVDDLEPFVANLAVIREEVDKLLETRMNVENSDGNESHSGGSNLIQTPTPLLNLNLL